MRISGPERRARRLLAVLILIWGASWPAIKIGVASLAYVGPIATAFAYWAVVEVGRHIRATTISMTLLAVPCVGLSISALTFHETVNVAFGLGVALVGAGAALTNVELSPKWIVSAARRASSTAASAAPR